MPKVYLITGTSTGFGAAYVQEILDQGDIAIATARKPESLSFKGTTDKNFLALKLDVTKKADIENVFKESVNKFGRVDVVCNNAGYGLAGPFEELPESLMRTQFEINYWGLLDVTRAALETMRGQSPPGGLIQQVTSIGGQRGVPNFTQYCATKWAVEGFTEALSHEVKPEWGIKLQLIEPGGFRTDWAGRSMVFADKRHPAYDHLDAKKIMGERNGTQVGDPVKGGKAMYKLANLENPPLRMVIGSDAYKAMETKMETYKENYGREDLKKIALSCDVEE